MDFSPVATFDFTKENVSPSSSPAPKRRVTTAYGEAHAIPIKMRNSNKAMRVLGSTPPNASRPIGVTQRKRKFENLNDDEMSDDTRTLPAMPTFNSFFGITKKLKKEGKESPVLKKNRAEVKKMLQKRKSGELARRKSGEKKGFFRVSLSRYFVSDHLGCWFEEKESAGEEACAHS
jgi:hypothetical protein